MDQVVSEVLQVVIEQEPRWRRKFSLEKNKISKLYSNAHILKFEAELISTLIPNISVYEFFCKFFIFIWKFATFSLVQ